jgi:hypothetical protein
MHSWRCSGFESGAIEASNRERRRHYFSGRAFRLKLPPGCAGAGNRGSMAGTKPDGGLRRPGARARRAGFTIEEIFGLTKIDRWFLVQIKEIVDFEEELATAKN